MKINMRISSKTKEPIFKYIPMKFIYKIKNLKNNSKELAFEMPIKNQMILYSQFEFRWVFFLSFFTLLLSFRGKKSNVFGASIAILKPTLQEDSASL